ncbi:phage tail protein [Pseudorhodoferax sp. Leaf265]|uniref:phage tail protein n=1 Tax=Pseudorhodoferax sp. Leaf265 TaxID=1736315 RepID=UPI0006F79AA2|nr:phage tail protein [Pseudorhodoferax sp. Leaf265]KQP11661.1 phage tail protein [Pseudorhodoferax sp. Leaf265]
MALVFEPVAPSAPADLYRSDVACFVGHVGRRAGRPLPDALRAQLDAGGWVRGPWARPPAQIEDLLDVPLALDSWHLFDRFYDWDRRAVDVDGTRLCASYLGAAVRSFFARGGRRAIVVRVGDPWPCQESSAMRAAQRAARLARLLPTATPFAPHEPASWHGLQHLYGLPQASLLLLPDLPDLCAGLPPPPDTARALAPLPEGFAPCDVEQPQEPDTALQRVPAPRLDAAGYQQWRAALQGVRGFLARHRRSATLLAALPLPEAGTRSVAGVHAQADFLNYLEQAGVLADGAAEDTAQGRPAEALSQLAWPWLRTRAAASDLPQGLEPADGILAGLVAQGAVTLGTHRAVAGDRSLALLRDVGGAEPVPAWGLAPDSPSALLARRVCLFAQQAEGWALQSDVSASALDPWRFGGASRLLATLLQAAQRAGETAVFEPNGPALWARLRGTLEELLAGFWQAGAFGGATRAQAFSVRCDRSTMTQADLDAGRLIAVLQVRPAMAIEQITVVLQLGHAASVDALAQEAT